MKQYRPMFAQSAQAPFSSENWIFEVKWDGIRAISYVKEGLSIRSRNQKELIVNFPELSELKDLTGGTVLDGEIIVMKDGKSDFATLIKRSQNTDPRDIDYMAQKFPATYIVFDILEKGVEGIMAKNKQSSYEPGKRSNNWLKIKQVKTCDCVIFGYTKGEGNRGETFGSLILGLYDGEIPVFIGKVGTGFSQEDRENLKRSLDEYKVDEETLHGVDMEREITWLRPSVVCEVGYQSITEDGKLRIPVFQKIREDKIPLECSIDQIRPPLSDYTTRRNFSRSPEPPALVEKSMGKSFVVQEHHARRLHYDLRLEKDGVLKSWAVPKGIPQTSGDRRLAVQVEDHPLEYGKFEGTIPEGQYGAGTVKIWDNGLYESIAWGDNKIEFMVKGEKMGGRYVLVKFKKAGEKNWLLIKGSD